MGKCVIKIVFGRKEMKKFLVVGIILLFLCSSIPVLAQNQDKMPTPLAYYYSFAFICGPIDWGTPGLFHFEIEKFGMVPSLLLLFIGFDKVAHRFRVDLLYECTITGGLHIGIITMHSCCVLAHNVTVS